MAATASPAGSTSPESAPRPDSTDNRYITYLVIVALAGWSLASYDTNLLTLTMPDIAKEFGLSAAALGALGFIVNGAEFVLALFVGWGMDHKGRKWMWMFCLAMAAVFTGLTFLVQNFWQLALVRALASGFAQAELAVSITLVNEQVPAHRRGFLYSIVQGGWPVGVFLASGLYLVVGGMGWRMVFLFGVLPLLLVAVGRSKVRESERFLHIKALREAKARGDEAEVARLRQIHDVDVDEVDKGALRQMWTTPGPVRRTLTALTVTWLFYATSFVATNVYITYWLTSVKGWQEKEAATLLMVCGGIGFFFYLLGGWIGERFGRKRVLVVSGCLVGPLNLLVLLMHGHMAIAIAFFLVYQATNGTWSGAGYSYQAECFPTRVRAVAVGWMSAMFVGGLTLGSVLWSALTSATSLVNTWLVVAVGLGLLQGVSTFFLPHIAPGQELEDIVS